MKLFRLVVDRDSHMKDAKPGELLRIESYYAAASFEELWNEIALIRADEETTILAIIEHAPAVQVVGRRNNHE